MACELGGEEAGRAAGVGSDHELLQRGVAETQREAGGFPYAAYADAFLGETAVEAVEGVFE